MLRCSAKTKVSSVRIYWCEKAAGCQTTSCDLIQLDPALRTSAIMRSRMTCMPGRFTYDMDYGCLISKGQLMVQTVNVSDHVVQSEWLQGSVGYCCLGLGLGLGLDLGLGLCFWSMLVNLLKHKVNLQANLKMQPRNRLQLWSWYRFGFPNEQVKSKYKEKQHIFGDSDGL